MDLQYVEHKHNWPDGLAREQELLSMEEAERALAFHRTFPEYRETPLQSLKNLAAFLGVRDIWVKDESFRFGLNAFKVLGGSYAIGQYLAKKAGRPIEELGCMELIRMAQEGEPLTFVTATDGNHGRGVAWTAKRLGLKSVVYMPKGSAPERLQNIRAEGAEASITELNYDDAVRLANRRATENGWIMVQDTAWDGYEDIPTWIMQGYATMACEAYRQLQNERPTHIFIQAGVGSLAGAVVGFFANRYRENKPVMAVVEPDQAACIYETMRADDGKRHCVDGEMKTIMAGLACGEPNTISLPILEKNAEFYLSCGDSVAADGMRILGNPLRGDERVISGESGAAGFGAAMRILTDPSLLSLKQKMGIDENSRLLFFSSEGDTDAENYRRIVWDGAFHRKKGFEC